jgi:hypothetical protein
LVSKFRNLWYCLYQPWREPPYKVFAEVRAVGWESTSIAARFILRHNMVIDKANFRHAFQWWRDKDTINFEITQPYMADPNNCFKLLSCTGPDGKNYILNRKNRSYLKTQGPFKPPYYQLDDYMDHYSGQNCFIFCPGPSMDSVDLSVFKNKFTIAVNSAGFKVNAKYWCAFESSWLLFLLGLKKFPEDRVWIMSSRCAIRFRGLHKTSFVKEVYIARFEDDRRMPHRQPAVCTMGAFFSAWWLGAPRIYVIGMDLSKPKGVPYCKNVPYTDYGASNPFQEQIRALNQFSIPEFTVFNGSPHSQDKLPFNKISYKEIEQIAKDSPDCNLNGLHETDKK